MEDHVRYSLERSFDYSFKGESVEAQFIELNEPTARNLTEVGQLRQSMVLAIRAYQSMASDDVEEQDTSEVDETAQSQDDGISADDVLSILAASPVKLDEIYAHSRVLFLSRGIAKIDGQEKLTQILFDKMSARDVEMMVGTYISAFILAS